VELFTAKTEKRKKLSSPGETRHPTGLQMAELQLNLYWRGRD
jgi:hypothetical protein